MKDEREEIAGQAEEMEKETVEAVETEETAEDKLEELSQKIQALEEDNAALKDQMLRQRAEIENYRKRLIREKEDAVNFANTSLISDLLQFIDNLDRAIAAGKDADVKALCEGVELIRDQLLGTLEKNWGLEKIDPAGQEFNPDEHEACMAVEDPEVETETVRQTLQTGYKLHSRVIRPAKVQIAKPQS